MERECRALGVELPRLGGCRHGLQVLIEAGEPLVIEGGDGDLFDKGELLGVEGVRPPGHAHAKDLVTLCFLLGTRSCQRWQQECEQEQCGSESGGESRPTGNVGPHGGSLLVTCDVTLNHGPLEPQQL